MPKPTTAQSKPQTYSGKPARRIVAVKTGFNEYDLVEEVFNCPPTETKVIQKGIDRGGAAYRVKLYNTELMGEDRYGDSGL